MSIINQFMKKIWHIGNRSWIVTTVSAAQTDFHNIGKTKLISYIAKEMKYIQIRKTTPPDSTHYILCKIKFHHGFNAMKPGMNCEINFSKTMTTLLTKLSIQKIPTNAQGYFVIIISRLVLSLHKM